MEVKYVGIFDSVFVPDIDAPHGRSVKRLEVVEVPNAVGKLLIAQEANWESVEDKSPSRATRDTADKKGG